MPSTAERHPSSTTAPARREATGILRWAIDRPIRVKLAALIATALLGLLTCLAVMLMSNHATDEHADTLGRLNEARSLILQLDTRASELKVDGYKAAVRPDPREQLAELADDIATPEEMIAALESLDLPASEAAAIDKVKSTFAAYTSAISAYVDSAIADQAEARAAWEDIQAANDITDGAVGEAKDLLEQSVAAESASGAAFRANAGRQAVVTVSVAALVLLVLAVAVVVSITRPLDRVRRALVAMAEGDLTRQTHVRQNDEVGVIARSLEEAQRGVRSLVGSVAASAQSVAAAAEQMSATSSTIANSAAGTSSRAATLTSAAESVSRDVQTVAVGAAEMGASITEIAHSTNEAVRVAGDAVAVAGRATDTVGRLGESSTQIASVVNMITSIAEQTNLLALNATIEAARAGDAGKGFAVVATEVKELAQETALATNDISSRVSAIQADVADAVAAIEHITAVITEINDYQVTIASAVEEQSATTVEMNRNVAAAASESEAIAATVVGLAESSHVTTTGVSQSMDAVAELSRMSTDLQGLVGRFTI